MDRLSRMNKPAKNEPHVKLRFLAEILLASREALDASLPLGAGFTLSDVLDNLDGTRNPTRLSGVYIDVAGTFPMFRAMAAKSGDAPLRSSTFSIRKWGLRGAFQKAVQARATFVGYQGYIPDMPPPSVGTILELCLQKRGQGWVDEKNIASQLLALEAQEA